jgi:tellurite resistance protein TehA-like permease
VWIGLQVVLLVLASMLRDLRMESGLPLATAAVVALMVLWFAADMAGLLLLVPAASRRLMAASAVLSSLGRLGMAAWSYLYLSRSLERQAEQYGPIGVTFGIFTYLLVAALVYVGAPLLVTSWQSWREGRRMPVSVAE